MADEVCRLGVDAIGIVAHKKSKRFVTVDEAVAIREAVAGRCPIVVVGIELAECLPYYSVADMYQAEDANVTDKHILSTSKKPTGKYKYFLYDASLGGKGGIRTDYPEWLMTTGGVI